MPRNPEWQSLRAWDGTQHHAFEELVCQLAHGEAMPADAHFARVAAPDAGKECLWALADGSEHLWQAKFFDTVGDVQWEQLTRSFSRALQAHPQMTEYTICIPLDRQDPRIPDQQWFMDRWNLWVEERQQQAAEQGRTVTISYWGHFEIWDRLSLERHRGRRRFWFGMEELDLAWFAEHVTRARDLAGERYTPAPHVPLEIAHRFAALVRSPAFWTRVDAALHTFLHAAGQLLRWPGRTPLAAEADVLERAAREVERALCDHREEVGRPFPFDAASTALDAFEDACIRCYQSLRALREAAEAGAGSARPAHDRFESEWHDLDQARDAIDELATLLHGPEPALANGSVLCLTGEAGCGKTHLFVDVAQSHAGEGQPTLLLFGERFTQDRPILPQAAQALELDFDNSREFLGAMDAAAEACGGYALILIDALNESPVWTTLWRHHLGDLIRDVAQFPHVRLAFSVRDAYVPRLLDGVPSDHVVTCRHEGFRGSEYEAVQAYFAHHGIEIGNPPLDTDFANPLFLKLFCQGLHMRGLRRMPAGMHGFTAVLRFFLDAVNRKVSRDLGMDESRHLVQEAVEALAAQMAQSLPETTRRSLRLEEARAIVDAIHRGVNDEQSLFPRLVREGILARSPVPNPRRGEGLVHDQVEVVHFSYERFTDYLAAQGLLPAEEVDLDALRRSPAGELLQQERACHANPSLVHALAVVLPERFRGMEIVDLVGDDPEHRQAMMRAFLNGLIWRGAASFTSRTEAVWEETREHIDRSAHVQVLLHVSCRPDHPFNADYLHRFLSEMPMADRDLTWSVAIHLLYGDSRWRDHPTVVHRLTDWAMEHPSPESVDDDVLRLWTTALAWTLSTSNRLLRDRSTKALVRLLERRLDLCGWLVARFAGVNDPYVVERVLCAAYGCALRSQDRDGLRDLAETVHRCIFTVPEVPANVLIRDYARGIVEQAVHLGGELAFDPDDVRPPYGAAAPVPEQSAEQVRAEYQIDEDRDAGTLNNYRPAWEKVMGRTDFRSYEIMPCLGGFGRLERHYALREDAASQILTTAPLWMLLRMVELGWRPAFNAVDRHLAESRRHIGDVDGKPETLTKKYAWIALREAVGRVADNHPVRDSWGAESGERRCGGPWEHFGRDIDPSFLLSVPDETDEPVPEAWWRPGDPLLPWSPEQTHDAWMRDASDPPDCGPLIDVRDPAGLRWFSLAGYFKWGQGVSALEADRRPRRSLYFLLWSYLVRRQDAEPVHAWLSEQNFLGRWVPEPPNSTENALLGEFPWHPAVRWPDGERGATVWTRETQRYENGQPVLLPAPVLVTTDQYYWDIGYDTTIGHSVGARLPCADVAEAMNLCPWGDPAGMPGFAEEARAGFHEGAMFTPDGRLAFFDPSLREPGPRALLAQPDLLLAFLDQHDYALLWCVLGEKQVLCPLGSDVDLPGRMIINGVYRLAEGEIRGGTRAELLSP